LHLIKPQQIHFQQHQNLISMFRKIIRIAVKSAITLAVLAVIVGAVVGVKISQIQSMIAAGKNMPVPSETATTVVAAMQAWYPTVRSVGNVVARQGVVVTTEVPGIVVQIHFESGQEVQAGQILLELDASTERAQLNSAVASADLAKVNVQRARELFEKQAIAKSELDAAEARFTEAEAMVENLRAVLAKKVIRAPFEGRLGIRQVNLGQFLGSGQAVVSLQSVDPIYVDFNVPQQRLGSVKEGYVVEVKSRDNEIGTKQGAVTAVSPELNEATRNALIRATLDNKEGKLRPGMFVEVQVLQPNSRNVLAVPATSVVFAPYGNSIFVLIEAEDGDGYVASQRFVRLGESRGDFVEVIKGIEPDEIVVTTGGFKLRNGVKVIPQNDRGLEFSLEPNPTDA
jgi:membrane fusion protein, multidrug efflux system